MASKVDALTANRFRVDLIGPFRLARVTGDPIVIQGRRTRGLLAYLLLAPGQIATRDRLASLFWGDRGESQAKASLRQCLLELKGALGGAEELAITATRESVALAPGRFDCDVWRAGAMLQGADWNDAVQVLDHVGTSRLLDDLELRGDFRDWVDLERARLEVALEAALTACVERLEAKADWAGVKALASAWLRRDPIAEPAAAALIGAEIASGAPAAAQRHYKAFKASLAAQLGEAPGPLVEAALRREAGGMAPSVPAPAPVPEARPVLPAAPLEPMLAVLAFENLSSDPELGFFCDGVSEEIQRTVANSPELRVVARASSFQFRGIDRPVAEIAAALGATHLLHGSVRRGGQNVRIGAELVDAGSGEPLWSDRFDGDLQDVFALQETIAEQVAKALKIRLAPQVAADALDPQTYEVFLRARSILAQGDPRFDDSSDEVLPLLEQVLAAAPSHAPAWEMMALTRAVRLRFGQRKEPFAEGSAAVRDAADRALALDPRRSGAWRALAMLEPWGAYARRETLLAQALRAAPHDPGALTDMSDFCWSVGRFRDALHFAEQASELNPLLPAARLHAAQMRAYVRDYAASVRMLEELHRIWPDNAGILLALLNWAASLDFPEVFARWAGAVERFEGWQAAHLRSVREYGEAVLTSDPAVKEDRVAAYQAVLDRQGTLALNVIVGVSLIGYPEQAFAMAEQASYEHVFDPAGPGPSAYYPGVVLGPWSTLLRDRRFIALCQRLGLCRYWVQTGNWPDCVDWVGYDFKGAVEASCAQPAT